MNTPHAPEPRRFAPTTGLPGLDAVLSGVAPGDNIVWQIQSLEDYRALVLPYAAAARSQQRRLIYFRFAAHPALIADGDGAVLGERDTLRRVLQRIPVGVLASPLHAVDLGPRQRERHAQLDHGPRAEDVRLHAVVRRLDLV